MTGPEHYAEAERLMCKAGEYTACAEGGEQVALVQRAMVHATLAQTAATIDAKGYTLDGVRRDIEWTEALS